MRVIGIIAEFNPFHNGHEYLIRKAREIVNDPRAIVMPVMSGFFTQRGLGLFVLMGEVGFPAGAEADVPAPETSQH